MITSQYMDSISHLSLLFLSSLIAACVTSKTHVVFDENYAVNREADHLQDLDGQREVIPSKDQASGLMMKAPLLSNGEVQFGQNYVVSWGGDHVGILDGGMEVVLSMDNTSGSGFSSKLKYGSGFFHVKARIPGRNSAGVVTAFYLTSGTSNHDELDFEFLGNLEGKPITLQTNVFADGKGNREQRISLWFDPTADFHDYKILWNPYQIVFYADDVPIRVFGNKTNIGVGYLSQPMNIIASLWNGDDWATDGGRTKINWSYAPFKANFQGFNIDGCSTEVSDVSLCSSSSLWWNNQRYKQLSSAERLAYENVKKKYMTYDYCDDVKRFGTRPPECPQ
ncbi:hypothetical protein HPP92_017063 [Vanilla planifolia]|uniref:Xyloglucan endotransglucosylase/hydrolase n=1 Tax=Vanilla planifolia TaxID=51239 RepID=A0A835UQN9_VANPL|nr:hypothetical protein HPP92_017063 [Vanilla planifolia]